MIAVLIKCTIYENSDHDRSPKKRSSFWVFIRLRSWSHSSLLGLQSWLQYSQTCPIFESLWGLRPSYIWVFMRSPHEISYFFSFCEDCNHDSSPHKLPHFWVTPHRGLRSWVTILISVSSSSSESSSADIKWSLMLFRAKHKHKSSWIQTKLDL